MFHSVAVHPSERHIITAGAHDGTTVFWDARQPLVPLATIQAHQGPGLPHQCNSAARERVCVCVCWEKEGRQKTGGKWLGGGHMQTLPSLLSSPLFISFHSHKHTHTHSRTHALTHSHTHTHTHSHTPTRSRARIGAGWIALCSVGHCLCCQHAALPLHRE